MPAIRKDLFSELLLQDPAAQLQPTFGLRSLKKETSKDQGFGIRQ